jgi:hypothetical protein
MGLSRLTFTASVIWRRSRPGAGMLQLTSGGLEQGRRDPQALLWRPCSRAKYMRRTTTACAALGSGNHALVGDRDMN